MNIEILLFYIFSTLAVVSGGMLISARNPVHSVLFLVLVFCNAAGLLILLETEFLAMLFLVVYVGAIAVLFLFVVMMLNVRVTELSNLIVFHNDYLILTSDLNTTLWSNQIDPTTNIAALGELLYTYYVFCFIVASLILLVSMVGAILLTMRKRTNVRKQEIFDQVYGNINSNVRYIS